MAEAEESSFTFHGLAGKKNLFAFPHCETDRFWRSSLGLTPERYVRDNNPNFDECRNAFVKPKLPISIDLLDHLHKRSDFE
jgi:hypothetical protein